MSILYYIRLVTYHLIILYDMVLALRNEMIHFDMTNQAFKKIQLAKVLPVIDLARF
jgi:hypothetical protein